MRDSAFADQEPIVGADRRDLTPDGGGSQAEILEGVHELSERDARHVCRAAGAASCGVPRESPHVAHVVRHRVDAVPRLEREVVAKQLEAKSSGEPVGGPIHGCP